MTLAAATGRRARIVVTPDTGERTRLVGAAEQPATPAHPTTTAAADEHRSRHGI